MKQGVQGRQFCGQFFCFHFCEIIDFFIFLAICDLVHDMECLVPTASGNRLSNMVNSSFPGITHI